MAWCLPKSESVKFLAAVNSGQLNPIRLGGLKSELRRAEIAKVLGDDTAKEVNTLFEEKLLMPNYMQGLVNWVKEVSGSWDPDIRKSTVDKITNLDSRILNPGNKDAFLSDLAAQKLGFKLKPEEAKIIFNMAQEAKKLQEEWKKNLDKNIPRKDVNDPVSLTRMAYGRAVLDLQDKIESLQPNGKTFLSHILDVAAMPKTVATGILHFSALGVQGWGMISKKVTWEAGLEQFKYFYDEKNYKDLMAYIISHPDYTYARSAKLGLTDVTDQLSLREEAIQSSLLQNFNTYVADKTGLPINVIGASSRAFTGYLNYVRFNRFVDLLNATRSIEEAQGRILDENSQIVKDLGSVVNNFTGRANLGPSDKFSNTQVVLNSLFFAPRKVLATVQMFNPIEYARLYKNGYESGNFTAANAAVKQLTGSIMATGALLYLVNSMGYSVDFDPSSQEFLKIKLPSGEKLDVTGGNAIWARFLGRMITGKEITAHGKEIELGEGYKPTTRADLAAQYIRGKLSPTAGVIADMMYGQDAVGRPFDIPQELRGRMQPILMSSLMNYYYEQPNKSVSDLPVLSALFGVNVESPVSQGVRQGMNVWGEPTSTWSIHDPARTPLDAALDKVGHVQRFPSQTINGVKLTDDQYKQYIGLSGQAMKARLTKLVDNPQFINLSPTQQQMQIKFITQNSKTLAQARVTAGSIGTSNDILQKSLENQRDKLFGTDEETHSTIQQSPKKSLEASLKEPVNSEEGLKQQWADLMIKDYDFGRMKETNPLAYLGYQAVKDQGVASYFKTPTSALGITNVDNADSKAEDYPLISKIMKEAGIDPKSAKGKIMLGPEFGRGENTYTLEHELMHRGMMELLKTGFKTKVGDHLMIQGNQHLYGNDKHSSELELDMMGNRLKPQYKNDEKAHKDFAEFFKDDIDDIQKHAKQIISKGK